MSKHYEMRFSGIGGQGAITAGVIMADAAVNYEGLNAVQAPTYTAAARGGPTKVDVIISDTEIFYPNVRHIDFFLSLHQKAFNIYAKNLKPDAIVLVDPYTTPDIERAELETQRIYKLPIIQPAKEELGNVVVANVFAVGAITELTGYLSVDAVRKAVADRVPKFYLELNMKAFDLGVERARRLR